MKVKVISLPYIFKVLYVLCFTWTRYQVSVYRTIGPLVYRSIASFQFQPYLEHLNVNKFSQALSKIRVPSHRLEIEAGRWARPHSTPINDRKCLVCQVLEDEYHFIIECQMYTGAGHLPPRTFAPCLKTACEDICPLIHIREWTFAPSRNV